MPKPIDTRWLGIMTGTSLDAVDLALVRFQGAPGAWQWNWESASAMPMPATLRESLQPAPALNFREVVQREKRYTEAIAECVLRFFENKNIEFKAVEGIGFHGQTWWHAPEEGLSIQLGDGARMAVKTGLPVVCDFRRGNLAAGGQGAPLVPLVDDQLFASFGACLNLGGIANLSWREGPQRKAADLVPCNGLLNTLAAREGLDCDRDGRLSAGGSIIPGLLDQWNAHPFYQKSAPKSLDQAFGTNELMAQVPAAASTVDALQTALQHIAYQISRWINRVVPENQQVLVSGGGAHHPGLVTALRQQCRPSLHIPDNKTVDFKEALAFAFLGMLRFHGEPNILASATGARFQLSAGALYLPPL